MKKQELEKFNPLKAQVAQVKEDSQNLIIKDHSTYTGVRHARTSVQRTITSIETIRKELGAPAHAYLKKVNETASELNEGLEPLKQELIEKIKDWDVKKAEEREIKAKAEAARLKAIQDRILAFKNKYAVSNDFNLQYLEDLKSGLESYVPSKSDFQEFLPSVKMDKGILSSAIDDRIDVLKTAMEDRYMELTGSEVEGLVDYAKLTKDLVELEKKVLEEAAELKRQQIEADKAIQKAMDQLEADKLKAEKALAEERKAAAEKELAIKELAEKERLAKLPPPVVDKPTTSKPKTKISKSKLPVVDKARLDLHLKLVEKFTIANGGDFASDEATFLFVEFSDGLKDLIASLKSKIN